MTWVRIHDGALSHPKLIQIFEPKDPFDLWVWGLSYVQTHLTDGFIPRQALPRPARSAITRLVELSLWEPTENGFRVHDYLQWNDSKELVTSRRSKAKERMSRVRGRTNGERSPEQSAHVLQSGSTWVGGSSVISHLQSAPETSETPEPISEESLRWFDRVYAAYPNKDRKQKAHSEWLELQPSDALAGKILADIKRRIAAGWVRLERRFVPQLGTFLHDRMWEDSTEELPAIYEDAAMPHAWQCGVCREIHEGTSEQMRAKVCLKRSRA
jgi:hypothetical protein